MSEFKLPPPRRLLRCDVPSRHDDGLLAADMPAFDELATIEATPAEPGDVLMLVAELVDELTISLELIGDEAGEAASDERVAEVA
jgi:hypothetical protein